MSLPVCDECRASIADFIEACRALDREMLKTRLARDNEFAQAWHQARKLGTEEDVVLAEELFPSIHFNSSPGVGLALNRMLAHYSRTGHKVLSVIREIRGE